MAAVSQALNHSPTALTPDPTHNTPTNRNPSSSPPRLGARGRRTAELLTTSPTTDEICECIRKVVVEARKLAASLAAKCEFDEYDGIGADGEETTAWKRNWMLQASNEARRIEDGMRTLVTRVILASDGEQAATSRSR
jgi:hypothetical protein